MSYTENFITKMENRIKVWKPLKDKEQLCWHNEETKTKKEEKPTPIIK